MLHEDEGSFEDLVQLICVPAPHEHPGWRELDEQFYEVQDTAFSRAKLRVELDPAASWAIGEVPLIPTIVYEALSAIVVSGVATGLYQLLKTWVDARNGRKLKIKVGDIEVEATQMKEEDVLRIFELLEEKADRKKIQEALIEAGKAGRPPEAETRPAIEMAADAEAKGALEFAGEKPGKPKAGNRKKKGQGRPAKL